MNILMSTLSQHLNKRYKNVVLRNCSPGGTLGVFFTSEVDGKKRFIKTHLCGEEYRNNLLKEIAILKSLYNSCLDIVKIDIIIQNQEHTFLMMNRLSTLSQIPDASLMQSIIADYSTKLLTASLDLSCMYPFERLNQESEKALKKLFDLCLVDKAIANKCKESTKILNALECRRICHGDLSNKNIMLYGETPIVLDWEDAFHGPEHYDICYWLTFFDQRKLYSPGLLQALDIPQDTGKALMLMIIILKCFLSYKNGSYKSNSLTFNERLQEVLLL